MTSAARERRRRERRAAGQSCYELVLDDVALEQFLECAGLLTPGVEHSKEIVALALREWLEQML